MKNETREQVCRAALISPPGEFRPLTAGSCCILGLMNSPLANLSEEALETASDLEIMFWAWVHAAPELEVRAQVVAARNAPDILFQHVLAWAETQDPAFFARAYAHVVDEIQRVAAGMAVHSKPTRSKNASGQSGWFPWSLWRAKMALELGRVFSGIFRCLFLFKSRMPRLAMKEAR